MQNNSTDKQPKQPKFTQTFQSSIQSSKKDKFIVEKTLYKGIKSNDVGKIIDIGNDGGSMDKTGISEEDQLELLLVQTRRKYDEAKTDSKKLESDIQKSQKIIESLKDDQNKLKDYISSAKTNFKEAQQKFEQIFALVESKTFDLDIYRQSCQTLKHDVLIIKKRNFDKDLILHKQKSKLKSLQTDEFNKTRLSFRCRDMLQSIERTVKSKQIERSTKMNSFYDVLSKKHQNIRKKEERERAVEEVMIQAMSQKLQEEKEWINIAFTNLFLKKFLKIKMERMIALNEVVENAFHKIRISTDIIDSKDFINRFLNRQKNYGTLLESISSKEYILQNLKQEKQKLQNLNNELNVESEEISEKNSIKSKSSSDELQQKQIDKLQSILKHIEEQKQLMYRWAIRFQCSFNKKRREDFAQKFSRKDLSKLILDSLQLMNGYITQVTQEQNNSQKISNAFLSMKPSKNAFNDDIIQRNTRVKTMSAYEEGGNSALDDRDALYDDISEIDFLQYNRRATKKNDANRRFRIKTKPF